MDSRKAEDADLTLTIDRVDLEQTRMGRKTLMAQIDSGTAKIQGDKGVLAKLASTRVQFTPDFEMMPGTRSPAPREDLNPFEVGPLELQGE